MRFVAAALEQGRWDHGAAGLLSSAWAHFAGVERDVVLPEPPIRVIGVAGPTLGGSYVTPVVEAMAREVASRGMRVAVVGHGYRARTTSPRVVLDVHDAADVGDEARQLASALHREGVPVVVGRPRARAIARAAALAPLVIVDALLQTKPRPLAHALLVV